MSDKSATDLHWSERAAAVADDVEVNLMDVFQRELEYDHVARYLEPELRILEVGCGNGYSTDRFRGLVAHVDAFDYSETMIERARASFGETNNRFLHDDLLEPRRLSGPYDAAICIRVLINLRGLDEQLRGIRSLAGLVRPGGLLVLVEGFTDGFRALDELRTAVGLPRLEPASINVYTDVAEVRPELERHFTVQDEFALGSYDYLTRVVYPLLAGPEDVRHNTVTSERCSKLARAFDPGCFSHLSRIRGFALRRRG